MSNRGREKNASAATMEPGRDPEQPMAGRPGWLAALIGFPRFEGWGRGEGASDVDASAEHQQASADVRRNPAALIEIGEGRRYHHCDARQRRGQAEPPGQTLNAACVLCGRMEFAFETSQKHVVDVALPGTLPSIADLLGFAPNDQPENPGRQAEGPAGDEPDASAFG